MQRNLGDAYARHSHHYRDTLEGLRRMEDDDTLEVMCPLPGSRLVGQLEQDPRRLFDGAAAGASAVHRAFTGHSPRYLGGLDAMETG